MTVAKADAVAPTKRAARAVQPRAQPTVRLNPRGPHSVASMLALQRLAGNHAVAKMVQREAPAAAAPGTDLSVASAIEQGQQGKPLIFKLRREHLASATVGQRTRIVGWVLSKELGMFAGGVFGGDSERLILDILATTPASQGPDLMGSLELTTYVDSLHDFVDGANNVILHKEMSRLRIQRFQLGKGKAPMAPPPVLPWSDEWFTSVTFTTERAPANEIKVRYPANLFDVVTRRVTPFTHEFAALPTDIFGGGHLYDADQPVVVHDHVRGSTTPLAAAQLLGVEARGIREFVKRAEITAAAGLTLGLAGPAAPVLTEAAGAAEGTAAATTAATTSSTATGVAAAWEVAQGPLVSAVSSMVVNVTGQIMEYRADWEKWNFKSIGFDALVAVIGGELASKLAKVIPVKVKALEDLANPAFYKNFTMQQSIFFLYGNTVAAIKNMYRKADSEKVASAAAAEQAVSAIKSVTAQSLLSTDRGLRLFPKGLDNPRWRIIDKLISLIANTLIQYIYDTTPKK